MSATALQAPLHWQVQGALPPDDVALDDLMEDVCSVTTPDGKVTADVGWYPEGQLQGRFVCRLVVDDAWDAPREEFTTVVPCEARQWLHSAVQQMQDMIGVRASTRASIFAEFVAELDRANAKFPNEQRLPDGTGGGGRKTWETLARNSCERAHREGRLTHTDVYDEETAEVMAAETAEELRKELIQVGAMTIKWLLDLDSR